MARIGLAKFIRCGVCGALIGVKSSSNAKYCGDCKQMSELERKLFKERLDAQRAVEKIAKTRIKSGLKLAVRDGRVKVTGPIQKSIKKKSKKGHSVWTVSGGLPSLGKRR